jgi:tetratricopeptide (TPR) repeat protein
MSSGIPNRIMIETMGRKILRPIMFLSAFFFMSLIVIAISRADIADDFLRKGHDRMRNNDYRQAIVYFESAYKIDPDNKTIQKNLSVAYHNMAIVNSQKGQYESSISNGLQALRFDPGNSVIKEQLAVFYNNYALKQAEQNNYKPAYENIKKALTYSPLSDSIKNNMYNLLLRYADYFQKNKNDYSALKFAKEAVDIMPKEAAGYVFIGNVYYNQDKFSDALKHWNRAITLDPDNSDLKKRIAALQRERSVEGGFTTKRKNYFRIRFDRDIDPVYVNLISTVLDDARRSLRSQFNLYSDEVIPVIIYDDRQFEQATDQPHWTQGLYDGKIRLRYQDASRDDKNLRRVLFHEYSHAVLYLNIGTNIPLWLNEGFAQFNEPERGVSGADKVFLAGYMKRYGKFRLDRLDEMFTKKQDQDTIRAAYLESKLFFNYLFERYGKYRVKRLFHELKMLKPWQKAVPEVYVNSIDRLELNFNNYLDELLRNAS